MFNMIFKWIVLSISLILVAQIVPGMEVTSFLAAMLAIVVIALVNTLVKPIVMFFTLPINILTLGLFTIVINAALFGLAAFFSPGFSVEGIFPALIGSILFSILSIIVNIASGQLKTA